MSIGAGSFAGAAVNGALVGWDFDAAETHAVAPADFWEERYAGSDRVWSGRVNRVLADVATSLAPGRALDLGCGEGADVLWLAQHGWEATGVDISPTAIARGSAAAEAAGADRARFVVADVAGVPDGEYDLGSASFLHSPVELPRDGILRRAATFVAPGGHLLITSHAGFPPGSDVPDGHEHRFLTPQEELDHLELDPAQWDVVAVETRSREMVTADGETMPLDDVVVLVRRRAHEAADAATQGVGTAPAVSVNPE